jgi:RNA ligase (TIGR02306 family)
LDNDAFAFLAPRGVKKIDEREYHVLKTARLRGQLSQGIVFPASEFTAAINASEQDGVSLDDALGILLYEPPQPIANAEQKGPWPIPWLRKTDAERVQNLSDEFLARVDDGLWVPTEKIDGTSLTFWLDGDELRICSRNFELKTDDPESTPVKVAAELNLAETMRANGFDAVQGELYGDQVNGNRLRINGHRLAVFAAWAQDGNRATSRFDALAGSGLPTAPVIEGLPFPKTVREAIEQADGRKSLINPQALAEGIVWHHSTGEVAYPELDYRTVWKAVSPGYLLKHKL